LTKNPLARSETSLQYKLDDLAGTAAGAGLPAVEFEAKRITTQLQAVKVFTNTFAITGDPSAAKSTLSRLSFVENSLKQIPSDNGKVAPVIKEAHSLLKAYRDAMTKLVENKQTMDELVTQMSGAAGAIMQGASAMKADLVAEQQRFEAESNAMIGTTERLIVM